MTSTGTRDAAAPAAGRSKRAGGRRTGSPVSVHRVGPVITTVAAVVGAVVMFGIGVLAGTAVASVLSLHGNGRTGLMLALGVALGVGSVAASARRHLPRG